MKKFKSLLALALAGAMTVSMCACGKTTTDDNKATEATKAENVTTEEGATTAAPTVDKTFTVGICQLVQHVALDAATEGFKKALTDKLGDNVKFEEMNASGDTPTCATIINTLVSKEVDLILANATSPLQAASTGTMEIPILGTSVTDYATALDIDDWTGATGFNVSGTSDLAPLDKQAEVIKELFPDAKTIGLLYCTAEPNSKYQVETIKKYLEDLGFAAEFFGFTDVNDLQAVTQSACDGSDVIYIPTDNTAASATGIIKNVLIDSKKPAVCGEEGICKGCGVATLSISYYDLGYTTGEMAYDILVNGADIATMQVKYAPNVTKEYNKEICDELGITIPEGYEAIATE